MTGIRFATSMAATRKLFVDQIGSSLDAEIQVTYGPPTRAKKDNVILSATTDGQIQDHWLKIGKRKREETYSFRVQIHCRRAKPDAAEEAACAVMAQIESIMANVDTQLLPDGVISLAPSDMRMNTSYSDQETITEIELTVEVKALLQ